MTSAESPHGIATDDATSPFTLTVSVCPLVRFIVVFVATEEKLRQFIDSLPMPFAGQIARTFPPLYV